MTIPVDVPRADAEGAVMPRANALRLELGAHQACAAMVAAMLAGVTELSDQNVQCRFVDARRAESNFWQRWHAATFVGRAEILAEHDMLERIRGAARAVIAVRATAPHVSGQLARHRPHLSNRGF